MYLSLRLFPRGKLQRVILWLKNRKYLLELFKRISKFHQKNMSQKRDLNFDQWETRFENYKPIEFLFK